MERLHLIIEGRVQGVFFRAHTQETARALGLTGWVRNTEDGGVEVVAEGARARLKALLEWCRKGPPMARVTQVDERWDRASGEYTRFTISY